MPGLTEAERRGALWLAALLVLGTLHDLYRAHRPAWAPAPPETPSAAVPGDTSAAPRAAAAPAPEDGPAVDLNHATVGELDRLPGIGPVLARRIIAHRDRHGAFHSPEELLAVPGIGPRLLERLRPHLKH